MHLAKLTYRLAKMLPNDERYRLTDQLLRAAASVPANLAEGHARGTRKDYARFVSIARGSLAETETFIQLAIDVELIAPDAAADALSLCDEVGKMLSVLIRKLQAPSPNL